MENQSSRNPSLIFPMIIIRMCPSVLYHRGPMTPTALHIPKYKVTEGLGKSRKLEEGMRRLAS